MLYVKKILYVNIYNVLKMQLKIIIMTILNIIVQKMIKIFIMYKNLIE